MHPLPWWYTHIMTSPPMLPAGVSDALHFGFLFFLLLCMYGVWAHFMFGPQAPDWVDPGTAITSIFRYVMYDYDLIAMEQQNRAMADLFY
jgi:hypothetical protein